MDDVRKRNTWKVLVFSALVLLLAFLGPLLGGSPSAPGVGFVLWGTAPALVAILLRLVTRDWRDSGFAPALGRNAVMYLGIVFAVPALMVLNLILASVFSLGTVSGFTMGPYMKTVLPGVGVFLVFAVFEEIGWRGYLVPKLAALGLNDFLSYAIVAAVWATWHLPFIRDLTWVYSTGDMAVFIPVFFLSMFAYSVLYFEVRLASGSVWPAVILHGFTNAVQHPMAAAYFKIQPGREYLVSFTGVLMIVMVAAAGLALRWARVRKAGTAR